MNELDFYLNFIATGKIDKVGLESSPAQWIEILGNDYVDETRKKIKRIDYGIIELSFYLYDADWRCENIVIQAQRLRHATNDDLIPERLSETYGLFSSHIFFQQISRELDLLGTEYKLIEDKDRSDYERYYVPTSQIIINTIASKSSMVKDASIQPGIIWSINLGSDNAKIWSKPFKQ